MQQPFQSLPKSFFSNNRKKLSQAQPDTLIVIAGNGLLQQTADNSFPFVQDSYFYYLTGLNISDAVLAIYNDEVFIIVPEKDAVQIAFEGDIDRLEVETTSGISQILNPKAGLELIRKYLRQADGKLSVILPEASYDKRSRMFTNPHRHKIHKRLQTLKPRELFDLKPLLDAMRVIKQDDEIKQIEQSVILTKSVFSRLENTKLSLIPNESYIEAEFSYDFRRSGSDGHAYPPIVAAGVNAATLHYDKNNSTIGASDLVVIDVGAQINHYAADITRTLYWGKLSDRQAKVLEAVKHIRKQVIAKMAPGTMLRDIELFTEKLIGQQLLELGLIDDPTDRTAIRQYYPHSVSHFLGLDVHDVGDYNQPLAPGMVLTCEPGIYIKDEAIGVRIEDDILITANGNRILGEKL